MTLVSPPVFHAVFRPFAAGSVAGARGFVIALCGFFLGSLAGAFALAVVARRRSARSHAFGPYRHATVGLLLSLSLLICFAAAVAFDIAIRMMK